MYSANTVFPREMREYTRGIVGGGARWPVRNCGGEVAVGVRREDSGLIESSRESLATRGLTASTNQTTWVRKVRRGGPRCSISF